MLADLKFNTPKKIDVLLGADVYSTITLDGKITLGGHLPNLFNTKFGWIILGKRGIKEKSEIFCGITYTSDKIGNDLQKLRELQEVGLSDIPTEVHQAETFFI
jgi:hypothetical protein